MEEGQVDTQLLATIKVDQKVCFGNLDWRLIHRAMGKTVLKLWAPVAWNQKADSLVEDGEGTNI